MLYERWRQIARECQDEIALRDVASGRAWAFAELAAVAEHGGAADSSPIVFPQSDSAEFVIAVLQAWRSRRVVCPLEPGQAPPHIASDLPAGIVHLKKTSATTGASRVVAFTPAQLLADAENIVTTMGLRPDWPNLGVISLAHSYGFSNLVLPLLLHGIPLVLVGSGLPEALRRAAATQPSFTLAAVPALWRSWHDANAIPSNIRLAISAGAPLAVGLEQSVFAVRGLKIHNFYGSSECGGIAYDLTAGPRLDGSCAGAPLRNVQLAVAEDGCLEVRGPAVGETYWPERSQDLCGGVFHTSDLAEMSFGLVYLRGRAGDQINVAGRKVSPDTIETALASHPQVRECLVFGAPSADAERGETIVACLTGTNGATSESLKQFLMEKLPAWQVPREWWFVESLQATERGKLSRAEWRKRYLEKTGGKAPNTKLQAPEELQTPN
ncbi:MAG: long-chain acyl-CoA synthetase [Verrucomicrobiota bacterium]